MRYGDEEDGAGLDETETERLVEDMLENHSTPVIVAYLRKAPGRLRKRLALLRDESRRLEESLRDLGEA